MSRIPLFALEHTDPNHISVYSSPYIKSTDNLRKFTRPFKMILARFRHHIDHRAQLQEVATVNIAGHVSFRWPLPLARGALLGGDSSTAATVDEWEGLLKLCMGGACNTSCAAPLKQCY